MKADYLDAEVTGSGLDHIDIEIRVNAKHVERYANEIIQATIDEMLEIIGKYNLRHYDGKVHQSVGADIKAQIEEIRLNVSENEGRQQDADSGHADVSILP